MRRACTSREDGLGTHGVCGQGDSYCALTPCQYSYPAQRFARADKRAKLPRWINQYISETASNLSTDMAVVLSKLFMRTISQNPNENQTGISLWTLQDVEKAQLRQKEMEVAADQPMREIDEEEHYDDGGLDDRILEEMDLDL